MFVSTIERLGMTEKESKLYLTSLRIGPSSMQVLARKAKIDRGTAYHVTKTLREKGLFEEVREGKRPLYRVASPKRLFEWVEGRKQEANAQFDAMQEMYSDLEQLYEVGLA